MSRPVRSMGPLQERFGRSRNAFAAFGDDDDPSVSPQQQQSTPHRSPRPNPSIGKYFTDAEPLLTSGDWRSLPEIPTGDELLRPVFVDDNESGSPVPAVPYNQHEGAWPSTEEYLKAQYALAREETTYFLRKAINAVAHIPRANEPFFKNECRGIGLYDKARVTAMTISDGHGPVTRMSFSTNRAQRRIVWETSSRLKNGSLLAVSPVSDMFKTQVFPATVAARPLSLLNGKVPEVDLYFPYNVVFDPAVEYMIIEESSSYFESTRDNMMVLQRMTIESFKLARYLIDPQANALVQNLPSLTSPSKMDLSPALQDAGDGSDYSAVDVLSDWPTLYEAQGMTKLDLSQMQALKDMLTKEVALIQGPPGTGKTHVSVSALKVLLSKMKPGDPPIVVTCQTNHALDQLLGHVAQFEHNFVRLGSRTADRGAIEARTLFRIKESTDSVYRSPTFKDAMKALKALRKEIEALLKPFDPDNCLFDHHLLLKHGVITQAQFNSLETLHARYAGSAALSEGINAPPVGPMSSWLGTNLKSALQTTPVSQVFNTIEEDLELEFVSEDDAEKARKEDLRETLQEPALPLSQKWTTITGSLSPFEMSKILRLLQALPDLAKMPAGHRAAMYHAMVISCKDKISGLLASKFAEFNRQVKQRKIGRIESDFEVIKDAKLIGMTTTGMSKFRPLIVATGAKIAMLEEAAESLECTVVPLFIPSLQQLIQVGDHKQLRPRVQKRDHEEKQWDISLFERLYDNGVQMKMLRKQRRMRWEVSRLLRPVYGPKLEDFELVDERPAVPGMGDFNTWFFDHDFPEDKDGLMSTLNKNEAELIVMFALYLVRCGTAPQAITILTFYNGQKRVILRLLRAQPSLAAIGVFTVDSYQGEENDVVLLSLTRSNGIGFVGNPNRVNVALSRAKLGLYIFGNKPLLWRDGGDLWKDVLEILKDEGEEPTRFSDDDMPELRIGRHIPITCGCGVPTHETARNSCRLLCTRSHEPVTTEIRDASDLADNNGGCSKKCMIELACGHPCLSLCHPKHISHSEKCVQPCQKLLPCGHKCIANCWQRCRCAECRDALQINADADASQMDLLDFPTLSIGAPVKSKENKAFNMGADLAVPALANGAPAKVQGREASKTSADLDFPTLSNGARAKGRANEASKMSSVANHSSDFVTDLIDL